MLAMGEAFRRYIVNREDVGGIIGIGGGGGTVDRDGGHARVAARSAQSDGVDARIG